MIYIILLTSLIISIASFSVAIIAFKESRKLNNKWKTLKRMKTERNHGFKIISC